MTASRSRPGDAIAELRSDHRSVEITLGELKATDSKDARTRKRLRKQMTEELATHLDLEEQLVFPIAEKEADVRPAVLKAQKQHRVLRDLLNDLGTVEPQEEMFAPKSRCSPSSSTPT
jgi:iron-sulfur cluster repair protein YtfE (RIC family)